MQIEASLAQARQWFAEGLFAQAQEMLESLQRQFEQETPALPLVLDLWRGLLAVAQARSDARAIQQAVSKLLQAGREQFDFDSEQMGALLHHAGQALAAIGAGSDAETFFTQAYRRLPDTPQAKFDYACQLAYFYASYNHLDYAMRWAREAQGRAADSAQKMLAERCVAALLDAQGKSLEAAGFRQQVQNTLSDQNPAWLLVDQARGQRRLGLASRADGLYREAVRLLPDGDKARIYRELALNLLSRRDLAGAETALLEGMQWVNPVSFEGQLLRAEQARLWQYQGRFAEAEQVILEVLATWNERFLTHHPLCLRLREVLIELAILRRDYLQALEKAGDLLKSMASAYGSEHPGVARALYWMAQVWMHEGEREKAKQALIQAQMIWDEWADISDVERALIHFGLGLIQADELEFYKAEEELRRACELIEQRGLGENATVLGHFLASLGDIHRITGRDRQSQEAAQRSQELLRPRK
jgi:hypothetical protein